MKITKTQLKRIIKEELEQVVREEDLSEFIGPFKKKPKIENAKMKGYLVRRIAQLSPKSYDLSDPQGTGRKEELRLLTKVYNQIPDFGTDPFSVELEELHSEAEQLLRRGGEESDFKDLGKRAKALYEKYATQQNQM
tara:strand:+ start:143 stop:553 length:411 start_codon:yes stop_codon:yes gene_type:complete